MMSVKREHYICATDKRFILLKVLIFLIIIPLFITISVPKEIFDSHIGLDYDIFCIHYERINAQTIINYGNIVKSYLFAVLIFINLIYKNNLLSHQLLLSIKKNRAPPFYSHKQNSL